jgi:hypothetical protein
MLYGEFSNVDFGCKNPTVGGFKALPSESSPDAEFLSITFQSNVEWHLLTRLRMYLTKASNNSNPVRELVDGMEFHDRLMLTTVVRYMPGFFVDNILLYSACLISVLIKPENLAE